MKIFIIAGEVSGDVLGAKIMREIGKNALLMYPDNQLRPCRKRVPVIQFAGIGGENMRAVGLRSLFPISDLSVMGFSEVLLHVRTLVRRIRQTAEAIAAFQPDIILTIDSPSFVKAVIKKLKNSPLFTIRPPLFYHVVAPQVWAWGAKRAKKYASIFDKLYCFFDFERPYFEKYGLKTIAVGHPVADGLRLSSKTRSKGQKEKILTLLPGSRMSEVKKLLPVFRKIVEHSRDIGFNKANRQLSSKITPPTFIIPVVETTRGYIESAVSAWTVRPKIVSTVDRYKWFAKTDLAIAASGTVTVELAIMRIPTIVIYKMNPITEFLARLVLKIKWVSLVNILLKKPVYPELLGRHANAAKIISEIRRLNAPAMIRDLTRADTLWHKSTPAAKLIADDILSLE